MKKTFVTLIALLLFGGVSLAWAVTATVEWDAPTNRIVGESCSTTGIPLTLEELALLQYTASYRVKGTASWTSIEVGVPRVALTGLKYDTTYQVTAAAHFPGQMALCPSEVLEFSTGTGPAPGGCSNLKATLSE